MTALYLDRLRLRAPGLTEEDGRRLVHLVAELLAASDAPGGPIALDRLRVTLAPHPGESLASTAARIAAGLRDALARSA